MTDPAPADNIVEVAITSRDRRAPWWAGVLSDSEVRVAARAGISKLLGPQALIAVFQLATLPILARLLTPEDFGLFSMAAVVVGVGNLLVDAGLLAAIVQRPTISPGQVSNAFWL